jgi:hypothetical protein
MSFLKFDVSAVEYFFADQKMALTCKQLPNMSLINVIIAFSKSGLSIRQQKVAHIMCIDCSGI